MAFALSLSNEQYSNSLSLYLSPPLRPQHSSCIRYIHIYNRNGTSAITDVGSQVATCDDCGPCGLQTVLSVQLTAGNYWYVVILADVGACYHFASHWRCSSLIAFLTYGWPMLVLVLCFTTQGRDGWVFDFEWRVHPRCYMRATCDVHWHHVVWPELHWQHYWSCE